MNNTEALIPGTLLQGGKYRIEKVLGQGGFGITYLAEQTNLRRKVCIKELFVKGYGFRNDDGDATVLTSATPSAAETVDFYRERFVKEARTIAVLEHPGIVRIIDVFEEFGTAYYVMDYIEGDNFKDLVRKGGTMSEKRALKYIREVASALSYVHGKKIMHLDVKPSNIIVRKSDDRAILIDFGTAKHFESSDPEAGMAPIGVSIGYAPIELMLIGGVRTFGPETDVYSLGATLYFLVTGNNPPDACERMEMLIDGEELQYPPMVSREVIDGIERTMQPRKKRPQSVASFFELFSSGKGEEEEVTMQDVLPVEENEPEAERKYLNAALDGDVDAQRHLAWCYLNGIGVPRSNQKAFKWIRTSAERGCPVSQRNLAYCYYYGALGLVADRGVAKVWLRKAAENGDDMAKRWLSSSVFRMAAIWRLEE